MLEWTWCTANAASSCLIIEYAVIVLYQYSARNKHLRELIDISRNSQAFEGESLNAAILWTTIDFSNAPSAWITVREIVATTSHCR